jgi:DNA repair exonuclease SbcCD ATPase subunit
LSFGSETGRTRSGTKGFSRGEKKQKKKKQDYHTHKGAYHEAERPDPEQVRARTILALDKLGHQVLSTEPGGYDLEHWTKNLNSLLDDFEEKIGGESITDEFRARRREAMAYLSQRSGAGEADGEVKKLLAEQDEARKALEEAERESASRLTSLRDQRDACTKELKAKREELAEIAESRQSRQFFSRILRSGPSTKEAEAKVKELEVKLRELEDAIERSRKARATAESGEAGQAQSRLDAARARLFELQSSRRDEIQLSKEREMAAQTISSIIASMKFQDGDANTPEAGA